MPSKIRVLNEHTINKIAAGEVVENAASAIKELVENSIDAHATSICIEIQGGGRQLIRITDNGCGMSRDDALLCLERHATSKIREVEDIHNIYTMGFRGEAVPSIAAISKFTLITAESGQEGTMIIIEGGKILKYSPAARSQGTTIEVKALFFNVPVRKKFQKSPTYDTNEIVKMITNIALGHPHIAFQLISDQKEVLSCRVEPGHNENELFSDRILEIFGSEFLSSTTPIYDKKQEWQIRGVIGIPSHTRHNRTGQYLFINQRAIQSSLISFAVKEGYGTMLMANRHPVYVLHLSVPASLVDVNVHPQKREVRLLYEQDLKEMIVYAVRKSLQREPSFIPAETTTFSVVEPEPFAPVLEPIYRPSESFIEKPQEIENNAHYTYTKAPLFQTPLVPYSSAVFARKESVTPDLPPVLPFIPNPPKVLAALKDYILIEVSTLTDKGGFGLVDQKSAHARIFFERLRQQTKGFGKIEMQPLLIPYSFETSAWESAIILQNIVNLNNLGIAIRQIAPHAFLVDAIPHQGGSLDIPNLIRNLIHDLQELSNPAILEKEYDKKLTLAVTRSFNTYNKRLSIEEAQLLINSLMQCEMPHQCPLGKTILVIMNAEEIAKKFRN